MSLRATLWAYDDAPVEKPTETLVLIALADEANDQGRNAFPSVAKIAGRARCKARAAKYALRALEEAGLIVLGDQAIAARHIARADRRPTVYDLVMSVTWESVGKPRPASEERGAADAPRDARGARDGSDGVHEGVERGARDGVDGVHGGAPDPSTNPTKDPTNPNPSTPPASTTTTTATRLPDGWQPDDALRAWFTQHTELHVVNPRVETEKFVDYWVAQPGAKGRKADWPATWRNWMRTAAERAGGRRTGPSHPTLPAGQQSPYADAF